MYNKNICYFLQSSEVRRQLIQVNIFLQKAISIHFTLIKTASALTAMWRISNFLKFQATTMTLAYLLSNEMCTFSATW